METILLILCIVFFIILTRGIIQATNINKLHKHNCRTIYIPENLDLEQAFNYVNKLDINGLKKRARKLGATKEFTDNSTILELKSFIVQNSIGDDHILFTDITQDIKTRDNIKKLEYCNKTKREGNKDIACPTEPAKLSEYSNVNIPKPINQLEKEHIFLEDEIYNILHPEYRIKNIIKEMKIDNDNYENKLYSFE